MLFSLSLSSALEFMSNCKVANPLDYLSCPIVSTAATGPEILTSSAKSHGDSVSVSRTRIEGGAKAVLTSGSLKLQ